MADLSPIYPGEVLSEDFLKPLGITPYRLSKATGMSQTHVGQLIRGTRSITPATALKLGKALGTSAEWWLNLQSLYDLRTVQQNGHAADDVEPLTAA